MMPGIQPMDQRAERKKIERAVLANIQSLLSHVCCTR